MAEAPSQHDTDEQHAWVLNSLGVDTRNLKYTPTSQSTQSDPSMSASAWDWTKDKATAAAHAIGEFDAEHGHVLIRTAGVAQAVGGVGEALVGAVVVGVGGASTTTGVGAPPGIPAMAGGGLLAVNGTDNAVAGLRTAWTGEFHHTMTSQAAGAVAHAAGASNQTAAQITDGVDLVQGIAGGVGAAAAGMARKSATDVTRTFVSKEAKRLEAATAAADAERIAVVQAAEKAEQVAAQGTAEKVSVSRLSKIVMKKPQIQHAFKHAGDFGITGNANNDTLAKFNAVIQSHIVSPGTEAIEGSYRGQAVTHFVDPLTRLDVIRDRTGEFLSGWKLSPKQLEHVLATGKLGGGK